jgi:hypothetical protein
MDILFGERLKSSTMLRIRNIAVKIGKTSIAHIAPSPGLHMSDGAIFSPAQQMKIDNG